MAKYCATVCRDDSDPSVFGSARFGGVFVLPMMSGTASDVRYQRDPHTHFLLNLKQSPGAQAVTSQRPNSKSASGKGVTDGPLEGGDGLCAVS